MARDSWQLSKARIITLSSCSLNEPLLPSSQPITICLNQSQSVIVTKVLTHKKKICSKIRLFSFQRPSIPFLCKTTCLLIWPKRKEEENKDMITIPTLKYYEIKLWFLNKISYSHFPTTHVILCVELNSITDKFIIWFFIKYLELHTLPLE